MAEGSRSLYILSLAVSDLTSLNYVSEHILGRKNLKLGMSKELAEPDRFDYEKFFVGRITSELERDVFFTFLLFKKS